MTTEKPPAALARLTPIVPAPGPAPAPATAKITRPRPSRPPAKPPTRRRRPWRLLWLVPLILLVTGVVLGVRWGNQRLRAAELAYRAVAADIDALQSLRQRPLTTLSLTDLEEADADLARLEGDLDRLDRATQLPLSESRIRSLPWVAPRYEARTMLLASARQFVAAARSAADAGHATLTAFAATGTSASTPPAGPTWLDVLNARRPELRSALAQARAAWALRQAVDDSLLPDRVQAKLGGLDRLAGDLLGRDDLDRLLGDDLDTLNLALGADHPVRYLVLFQNSAEARLSGGFPGTIALVTVDRGQLRAHDFFDAYDLQDAYAERPHTPVVSPWPVVTYFRHPELPIVDATWPADFQVGARQLLAMYADTGWPPVDGVVALTPAVVSDLLELTGPIAVEIDGETREITAGNVHEEIERDRALVRAGVTQQEDHKAVLALIGASLIEQLKAADRAEMKQIATVLGAAADRRDIQAYSVVPRLASILEERRWDGRLLPDPALPTLAIDFSSLVTTKSSGWIEPHLDLEIGPAIAGWRRVSLRLDLFHAGNNVGDPFYFGFQRWWVEIRLPQGSLRLSGDTEPMPDPRAPDGGSYDVELQPQTTTSLSIDFAMPDGDALLLRRQPGVTPVTVAAHSGDCAAAPLTLDADAVLSLPLKCGS